MGPFKHCVYFALISFLLFFLSGHKRMCIFSLCAWVVVPYSNTPIIQTLFLCAGSDIENWHKYLNKNFGIGNVFQNVSKAMSSGLNTLVSVQTISHGLKSLLASNIRSAQTKYNRWLNYIGNNLTFKTIKN